MPPAISVVMSTYNRESMVSEAIESVLSQSFNNFEFIIVDDCSTDNTRNIIKKYNDKRVKLLTNNSNRGCTFNYHIAQNVAKGDYIAHIDDDDIWIQNKLELQFDYLESHKEIALVGSFIETFGANQRPSWVFYTEPEEINFMMNFYNPICHSSILYRKSFMEKNNINYDFSKKCAQDYDFYKQIILKGGLISNIDKVLVKYRMHPNRYTDIKESQDIQIKNAEIVKKELLSRYFSEKKYIEINKLMNGFPFNNYEKISVIKAITYLKDKEMTIAEKIINDIETDLFKF